MIKRLRKRFIRIATLAVTGVMLVLCIALNTANFLSVRAEQQRMLDMICDNQGTLPSAPPGGGQQPLLCPDKFRQPGLHRPGHIAHIRLCAVMEQAKQCRLVRFTPHQRLSGASQRVLPHGVKCREMAVGAGHQRLGVGNIPHIQIRRHRVVRVKMPPGIGRNRFVHTVASG